MKKRGQGMIDFVVVFAVVVAVLVVMGIYVRNSLSGKWREAADTFGQGEVFKP